MKTNVSQSSIRAYRGEIAGWKENTQMAAVMEYLTARGWVSRKQIAQALDLEPGTVAGRVNELVALEAIRVDSKLSSCPITGRSVHLVRAAEDQPDLFGSVE